MEYPRRKNNRLIGFDYSSAGTYFITICTADRECTLATIIDVGDGFPVPQLTGAGYIADKYINFINNKYPTVFVDNYVIMPNHIHLLLVLCENGTGNPSPTIGNVVGWLKYVVTKQINIDNDVSRHKIFQRSYHDHIVRNEPSYRKIYDYITNNPLNWENDCFYNNEI